MKKILLLLFFIQIGFTQQEQDQFSELKDSFEAFEYQKTISLSNEILSSKDSLTNDVLADVLRMQAIAYYSLDDLSDSQISFLKILEIKPNFILNESETSPKIVAFFDKIKLNYLSEQMSQNPPGEDSEKEKIITMEEQLQKYRAGMLRSLVLPGWGHYYIQEENKAIILNMATILTLTPGIYYYIQTEKYEKEYLNESYTKKIESKYGKYNNAYKNRNYFLTAFTILWLYTQYDYFFASHDEFMSEISVSLNSAGPARNLQLQFSINF